MYLSVVILTFGVLMVNSARHTGNHLDPIDTYLEGWMAADPRLALSKADPSFTITWVPTGDVYNTETFPAFFDGFVKGAFDTTGWYNLTFFNFNQWEEAGRQYEAADWIVDGFDSGIYTVMVRNGKLMWGRPNKLPVQNPQDFTFKQLCNKRDRVCKNRNTRISNIKKLQG